MSSIDCPSRRRVGPPIVIDAKVFGDRYTPEGSGNGRWGRHPLLEATIVEVGIPAGTAVEIAIDSAAPFGASIGTSAATCVALDRGARPRSDRDGAATST